MSNKNGAENIHWDLSDLYNSPTDTALESDTNRVIKKADEFNAAYRGRVAELDAAEFAKMLQEYEDIIQILGKIGSYAHLIWSTNTEDSELGKLLQKSNELSSEVSQKLVFSDVEWLKIEDEKANKLIQSDELSKWKHYLEVSRFYKEHTLSEEAEKVMSAKSVTGRAAWNRYFDETLGAARFELDDEMLTEQEVLSKLHEPNRDLRKKAHASLTETFQDHSRTLTFIFNTILADKSTNDKLRNYDSWITSRNLSNQTDIETVDALVTAVTDNYPLAQRYYKLKRKLLGVDEMFDYDRYAPITKSTKKVEWNEAKDMVLEAYGDFHPDMSSIAGEFFENNWIDAAIKPGKRGGAYSASTVTSVHPYVFMNFDGKLRDVQTLAHELGHGVHQYLARKQGELQSSTPLTTAETASVFGEMLVFNKLMNRLDDPSEKLALLVSKIDDTIATVFRQISMNRFEDKIHTARREQGELSKEQFSEFWIETQKDLYGDSVTLTDEYKIWWSYIPHFLHTPGYVYAYAFGELLVLALYDSYKSQKNGFSEKYLSLLEAGGSDWPHNLVSTMGLDIKDKNFWSRGLDIFGEMVKEAEELAASL
ncbi:M3 family oligoendopeptidase [Rhodohalobacter sulfatireducens]|uniref:M3 family oligoendopeptidase n=1 Tax=Rhodohalobacter sulfatireducens TaxID=2911366 RepID=A0ABS9KBQ0_9BACT|nr:M3 family oligoendopeptidase [Rhodohalobacter sulfatireducens]MCG2588281.1 M3 family oligoendopeptidase [Rhodohalobacter sulfatireducens]